VSFYAHSLASLIELTRWCFPSPTFSPAFYCKIEYAWAPPKGWSYDVFRPHLSSPYFKYACGGFGCQALYLQTSSPFRYEAGEYGRASVAGRQAISG